MREQDVRRPTFGVRNLHSDHLGFGGDIFYSGSKQADPSAEIILAPEQHVTAERLLKDNQSDLAEERREALAQAKAEKKLVLKSRCLDNRITKLMVTRTLSYETVAGAGNPAQIARAINAQSISFINAESHHGPEEHGIAPGECLGRSVKGKQMQTGEKDIDNDGLGGFVSEEVEHYDVVLQANLTGIKLNRLTDKPVVVSAQNHRTGENKIISITQIKKGILRTQSAITNQGLLYPDRYNPEELYVNGVPFIPLEQVENDEVREYFQSYAEELRELKVNDPDFEKKHILHNPSWLALLTDVRSGIMFPGQGPSSIKVTIPRGQKGDEDRVLFQPEDVRKVWAQAKLIIPQAAQNFGDPRKPFSYLSSVFFGSSNYDQAKELMMDFIHLPFMSPWLRLPYRELIIAQTKAGRITKLGEIHFEYDRGGGAKNPTDKIVWEKS